MLSDSVLMYTGVSVVGEDEKVGTELVEVGICGVYAAVIGVWVVRGIVIVEVEEEEPRRLE